MTEWLSTAQCDYSYNLLRKIMCYKSSSPHPDCPRQDPPMDATIIGPKFEEKQYLQGLQEFPPVALFITAGKWWCYKGESCYFNQGIKVNFTSRKTYRPHLPQLWCHREQLNTVPLDFLPKMYFTLKCISGLLWWSSGWDTELPMPGTGVRSLVRELHHTYHNWEFACHNLRSCEP